VKMISMIAAMTADRVLGNENQLPWHVPADQKNFKKVTTGHVVVMGRKTFDSMGRPLPKRRNIVVSRSMKAKENVEVYGNIETALERAGEQGDDVFIIGGAQIYEQCLAYADTMHLSYINGSYPGDAFFPEFEESDWEVIEDEDYEAYTYRVYRRISRANPAVRSQ
jgi:dihydrofolate reductase